jgi:hypothetical protein
MENSATCASNQFSENSAIWHSLKQAIASSSGFHRWQSEHPVEEEVQDYNLDHRVRCYLRETLETLAY